ncbi:MAG: hypothetical protein ACTHVO_14380 [Brevibacterium yomogidense]
MDLTFAEMSRQLESRGRPIPPLGLRRIEAGERRVDVDDLMAIAVVLDVSPMRLLLPGVQAKTIDAEASGAGAHSTHDLWTWALGYKRLGQSPVESRDFLRRSSPRRILSRKERATRRAEWLIDQVEDMKQKISSLSSEVGEEDQYAAAQLVQRYEEEIDVLDAMDPANDDDFAFLGDEDPAPPSPEELEGLLTDEDDDGAPKT